MKRFRLFMNKEPLALPVVLIVIGLIAGYITARIFYSLIPDVIVKWNNEYIAAITNTEQKRISLFLYIVKKTIKEVLIYFMLCLTILGIPYYVYTILKKSFQVSFLVSTFIHVYTSKGIFMAFCNYFPQMLLYLPASYLCIKHGFSLYTDIQSGKVKPSLRNNALIKRYGKNFLFIILLFTVGAVLEAFVGRILWSWAAGAINN